MRYKDIFAIYCGTYPKTPEVVNIFDRYLKKRKDIMRGEIVSTVKPAYKNLL
jgi:hypothetical protein